MNKDIVDEILKRRFPDETFDKDVICISKSKIEEYTQVLKRAQLNQSLPKDEKIIEKCKYAVVEDEYHYLNEFYLMAILILAKNPYQAFITTAKYITIESCYTSIINLSYGIMDNMNMSLLTNIVLPCYRYEELIEELQNKKIALEELKYCQEEERIYIEEHTYAKYERVFYCIYCYVALRDEEAFTLTLLYGKLSTMNYWLVSQEMINYFIKKYNAKVLLKVLNKSIDLLTVKQIDKCIAKILLMKNADSIFKSLEPLLEPYKNEENIPHIDKFYSIQLMKELAENE